MGSKESRSYSDADHIWGWSERLTQWCDSDPEPGADADLIFQPCREAEKALGNCEQHHAHIVQRHLDACENTYEAFLNDGRSDQWADFLRAADLLRDKLKWLSERMDSSVEKNTEKGRDESELRAATPSKPETSEPIVVHTIAEWQTELDWSPTTWARRRKEYSECFIDVPGENACSIREPELSQWLASAANRKRSPFGKP